MKQLSEFVGQEHIVAVLRGMVIKQTVRPLLTFYGDDELTTEIMNAFVKALNCEKPVKGDWCGECRRCKQDYIFQYVTFPWTWEYVLEPPERQGYHNIYVATNDRLDGFFEFEQRFVAKNTINSELLVHLVHSVFGDKAEAVRAARATCAKFHYLEIVSDYSEILKALLYLKNNVESVDFPKMEVLRQLAGKVSPQKINAVFKLLWSANDSTKLQDCTHAEMLCAMIAEVLNPDIEPAKLEIVGNSSEKPIVVVEEKTEQPLSLAEMIRIARE